VRGRLRELLGRPEIREAIFVASPSLDESMGAWLEQPASERGQKVERTLMRYLVRMAGRSTPFGLFAGCSVGTVGGPPPGSPSRGAPPTSATPASTWTTSARSPTGWRAIPGLRPRLTFRPNSSLYRVGDRAALRRGAHRQRRRAQPQLPPGRRRRHRLPRRHAGARRRGRATGRAGRRARRDPEIALEEAKAYVDELIDNQVLVPDLEPAVTGPEPIHGLVDALAAAGAGGRRPHGATRDAIDAIDRRGVGGNPASRLPRDRRLARGAAAPVELPRLFQVDMVKPAARGDPGRRGGARRHRRRRAPAPMSGWSEVEGLRQFREKFGARYETREVPLVEALDEESGIGFERTDAPGAEASPLLEGLVFGGAAAAGGGPSCRRARGAAAREAGRRRRRGARSGAPRGRRSRSARAARPRAAPRLPDAFAVMGCLIAASPEAPPPASIRSTSRGDRSVGSDAARALLPRRHPPRGGGARHLAAEEAARPGAVFAEIVHLPEGRIGNVIARPVLRGHEIVYLGRSARRPIGSSRSTISWSRSPADASSCARRGWASRSCPRLTNAHNYGWRATSASTASSARCSGRARRGGLRLGRARRGAVPAARRRRQGHPVVRALAGDQTLLEPLGAAQPSARWRAAQDAATRAGLPRWVAVADGDNELPVDLDNALSVETFASW
jgi:hypothetical protein